jgi:hypothetical protein
LDGTRISRCGGGAAALGCVSNAGNFTTGTRAVASMDALAQGSFDEELAIQMQHAQ